MEILSNVLSPSNTPTKNCSKPLGCWLQRGAGWEVQKRRVMSPNAYYNFCSIQNSHQRCVRCDLRPTVWPVTWRSVVFSVWPGWNLQVQGGVHTYTVWLELDQIGPWFCTGVNTNRTNRTLVRSKQLVRDLAREVVLVLNSIPIEPWCTVDRTRFEIAHLFKPSRLL